MADKTMDEVHRKILSKNLMRFKTNMTSLSDVLDYLQQEDILTESMIEEIQAKKTESDQKTELHRIIPKRGAIAFDKYYLAMRISKNHHLALVLEPHLYDTSIKVSESTAIKLSHPEGSSVQETVGKSPVVSPVEEDIPDIPEVWPDVTSHPLDVKVIECQPDKEEIKKLFCDEKNVYCMKSKSARVLIINNKNFERAKDTNNDLSTREGTNIDATCLDLLFKGLGFHNINTESDLTANKMMEVLQNEAATAECEGFICFVLSHGTAGKVYGTDGVTVSLSDIYNQFDGRKCPGLIGKPKLFFIQACQGTAKDKGAAGPMPVIDIHNVTKQFEGLNVSREQTDAAEEAPTKADILMATATTEGYVSFRNTEHGTWFIQAFIHVVKNCAHKYDLLKILTRVNRMVAQNRSKVGGHMQVSERKDTLTKEFYFFPGLGPKQSRLPFGVPS